MSEHEAAVDLPDPETLGPADDFSRYLADGVPAALRRRALRVLWRSDPVLANLDGLNEYDEDFSKLGMVAMSVQSAWQSGRGYAPPDDESGLVGDDDGHQGGEAVADSTESAEASDDIADEATREGADEAASAGDEANGGGDARMPEDDVAAPPDNDLSKPD